MPLFSLSRVAAILVVALSCNPVSATPKKSVDAILAKIGAEAIRLADSDFCYPSNSEEYEALGKNGVIRIQAASAISTELPLRSAYLESKGLRIPLHRIVVLEKAEDSTANASGTKYWRQVSFYTAPLNIIRAGSRLVIDFTGQRTGFVVTTFPAGGQGPAFARLDEYNTPSEPDSKALAELLAREYPDDF